MMELNIDSKKVFNGFFNKISERYRKNYLLPKETMSNPSLEAAFSDII